MKENQDEKGVNMSAERNMLTGMFRDRESTENAYKTLQEKGYTKDEINLVMSEETCKKHFSGDAENSEIGTKAAEGAGKDSALGGTIGSLVGSGIPEARAKLYESGIKDGNIFMGVNPHNDKDSEFFENNWRTNKGEEIHH